MTNEAIKKRLRTVTVPYLHVKLTDGTLVKRLVLQGIQLTLDIELPIPFKPLEVELSTAIRQCLNSSHPELKIQLNFSWQAHHHNTQPHLQLPANLKNIIAVASGKGGVGKSTVSANLAIALSQAGAKVGLLDADIYGPSQPLLFGVNQKPAARRGKITPIIAHGVALMSIGFLVDTAKAVAWRGPMVSGALQQLLRDTDWPELDYLIIDLPPGTGDIQLTLAQKIPVTGALIVTTPQDLALIDAERAMALFDKVRIPVLGIIENMSFYHCPHCAHDEQLFGSGAGNTLAKKASVPLLGQLPLLPAIHHQNESGAPYCIAEPKSHIAKQYQSIALTAAARLSELKKNYQHRFPNIKIER